MIAYLYEEANGVSKSPNGVLYELLIQELAPFVPLLEWKTQLSTSLTMLFTKKEPHWTSRYIYLYI